MTKKLTVSSIAELVNLTSSKVFISEEKQIKPDLSFETAKLAVLGMYDRAENVFPFEFNADSIEVDSVKLDLAEVKITWRLKGGTMPIDNNLSVEQYSKYAAKAAGGNETLEVIKCLKDEFNNYIPLYEVRNRLTHLTRAEQDEEIYSLMRKDVVELSKLNEPWLFSDEQRSAGIPTPISGDLFFVILN